VILACDVGGTKTNLALVERGAYGLRVVRIETFRSQDHPSLDGIVAAFVGTGTLNLEAAGFGIAGPVLDGRVRTTNLPWSIDAARVSKALGLPRVSLVNDVEAQAWSVPLLGRADHVCLQAAPPQTGTVAVMAAGTGLGMSALVRRAGALQSLASEGGHADFSPGSADEMDLLRVLQQQYGHVSAERVVSGPGLFRIYEFLRDRKPDAPSDDLAAELAQGDPSATVARAAQQGRSALAEQAVLLFLGAYGAEAGNWALRTMAMGGMWLGGGVAQKLLVGPPDTPEAWRTRARAAFLERFCAKGRLSPLLQSLQVHVMVTDEAPLLGAAHYALVDGGGAVPTALQRESES